MRESRLIVGIAVMAVALAASLVPTVAWADGQNGTTLTADVSCVFHFERTFHWTIDKAVTPASLDMFRGDSGTVKYTVTVTKDAGTDQAFVNGYVSVTNGGAVATENLAISIDVTMPPSSSVVASGIADLSGMPVLAASASYSYPYSVNIGSPQAGDTYKVTAHVTITNHSGHLGTPSGPDPSCSGTMPENPTLINDTINVDDTNGGSWTFGASGSASYDKTFTCDGDEGTLNNTATIRETGQSDDASVTVNCYALEVTKDASTEFTRTYQWKIAKIAKGLDGNNVEQTYGTGVGGTDHPWDQYPVVTLSHSETFCVPYEVTVDLKKTEAAPNGYVDSAWKISGNIHVNNPAPLQATINGVTDAVSGIGSAAVDCGVTFPYSLAAGGTLNCTYSLSAADGTTRTNTATATLQNTPSGTTSFTGSATVDFSEATIEEIDKCITVTDETFTADFETAYPTAENRTVCADAAPKTFKYCHSIGPIADNECANFILDNIASFSTADTSTKDSAEWKVAVTVTGCPLTTGCTLTPGYWKTHSTYGPAPYDQTWAQIGEDTVFFLSGQTYYEVLWTNPQGGNAYYILAHAYIAAELNQRAGASMPTAVEDAFNDATDLFNTYTPAQILALKGKNATAVRAQFIGYAAILDQYNNGLAEGGPPHCAW
jgi:hypothetical protein